MTGICTCCGQPLPESADKPTHLGGLVNGLMPRTILRRLIKAYPGSVSVEALQDHVYAGVNDVPLTARTIMAVQVHRLRKLLEPSGWTIPTVRRGRSVTASYRLEKLS